LEIYRKCKAWFDKDVFLHLDIWEDLSARMSATGSQSEYNKKLEKEDMFILLAWSKVEMYTAEEFEKAFGQFQSKQKPFIFTYFKNAEGDTEQSLAAFQEKLSELNHFYSPFSDSNDLWNQFNKELDRLEAQGFTENKRTGKQEERSTINQQAEKIYNIEKIDKADFS